MFSAFNTSVRSSRQPTYSTQGPAKDQRSGLGQRHRLENYVYTHVLMAGEQSHLNETQVSTGGKCNLHTERPRTSWYTAPPCCPYSPPLQFPSALHTFFSASFSDVFRPMNYSSPTSYSFVNHSLYLRCHTALTV